MLKSTQRSRSSATKKQKSRTRSSKQCKGEASPSSMSTRKSAASTVPIERTGDTSGVETKTASQQDLPSSVDTVNDGVRVGKSAKPTATLTRGQENATSSSISPTGIDAKRAAVPSLSTSPDFMHRATPVPKPPAAKRPSLLSPEGKRSHDPTASVGRPQDVQPSSMTGALRRFSHVISLVRFIKKASRTESHEAPVTASPDHSAAPQVLSASASTKQSPAQVANSPHSHVALAQMTPTEATPEPHAPTEETPQAAVAPAPTLEISQGQVREAEMRYPGENIYTCELPAEMVKAFRSSAESAPPPVQTTGPSHRGSAPPMASPVMPTKLPVASYNGASQSSSRDIPAKTPRPSQVTSFTSPLPRKTQPASTRRVKSSMKSLTIHDLESIARPPPEIVPKQIEVLPKTPCAVTSFVSVVLVLSVGALGLASLWISKTRLQPREHFCRTEDCLLHSRLLDMSRGKGIDPCEDFAAYVCSAWSPRKDYDPYHASAMDEGRILASSEFRATLSIGSQKLPVGRKPLAMYDACMGLPQEYGANISLFRDFLKECRLAWPGRNHYENVSPLEILLNLSVKWQTSVLFQVKTFWRTLDHKWIVTVTPGRYLRLALLQNHYVTKSDSYADYFAFYSYLLSGNGDVYDTGVNDTLSIEKDILERLHSTMVPPFQRSELVQVSQMDSYTPTVSSKEWLRILRVCLNTHPELQPDDLVWLSNTGFFLMIGKILVTYRNDTDRFLSVIAWFVVQLGASITDYGLLNVRFGDDATAKIHRPLYCATAVEAAYPILVAALQFVARFSPEKRAFIDEAFKNLTLAAGALANETLWLDDASRPLAAQKISSIRMRAWPVEYLMDGDELGRLYADFPEKEPSLGAYWFVSIHATAANAELRQAADDSGLERSFSRPYVILEEPLGSVNVAVGVLNRPLYYVKGTKSMLYGGFGFSVALELVRSLDRQGMRWHPNGTYGDTFLSSVSTEAFDERDRCLSTGGADGIESVFPEIPALEVAYTAYRASLQNDSAPQGIGADLAGDVVFFMTACYTTCTHDSPDDPPNPYRRDCNKAMRNFKPFAKAFNCPLGSRMNPDKKCPFFTK